MKPSGCLRKILINLAIFALAIVIVGGSRILWVKQDNAIFAALAAHDNARVIVLSLDPHQN